MFVRGWEQWSADPDAPVSAVDASTLDSSAAANDEPAPGPLRDSVDASTGMPRLRGAEESASGAGCDCRLSTRARTPPWPGAVSFALVALLGLYRRSAPLS